MGESALFFHALNTRFAASHNLQIVGWGRERREKGCWDVQAEDH